MLCACIFACASRGTMPRRLVHGHGVVSLVWHQAVPLGHPSYCVAAGLNRTVLGLNHAMLSHLFHAMSRLWPRNGMSIMSVHVRVMPIILGLVPTHRTTLIKTSY
jgi:hypothetical protein